MGPLMFLLREKRRRIGCLGLFVSLMGFIMCMLTRDRYLEAAIRLLEAPYIYVLQRSDSLGNLGYQFIVKGYQGSYEAVSLMDLLYAVLNLWKVVFYARLLSLPLAFYHYRMFTRVAQSERRMRRLKNKALSWTEYLHIYVPVACKASFFTVTATTSLSLLAQDNLGSYPSLLYPTILSIQFLYFLVGLHGSLAYCSAVATSSFVLGLSLQPLRLPHVTNTLTALLASMQIMRWVAEEMWKDPHTHHFNEAQRVRTILSNIEARLAQIYDKATLPARFIDAKLKPVLDRAKAALASFSVKLTFDSPARSHDPTSSTDPSHVIKPSPARPSTRRASSLVLPLIVVLLVASGVLLFDLLRAQPERHTLRFGEVLRVGERRQYRCNVLRDWRHSSSCRSLDLVLHPDGSLRLYDTTPGTEAIVEPIAGQQENDSHALLWASKPQGAVKGAKDFSATLDERARLVVSSDSGRVIYRTPRLVYADTKASPPQLSLDGSLGGFYITHGQAPDAEPTVPTFASTWETAA